MELFSGSILGLEADLYRPLLAYLQSKKSGKIIKPYVPRWELMSLQKQCRLALLWKEAGFTEEAGKLADWLLKLKSFPTLWSSEKEYDEAGLAFSFSKLQEIEPIQGGTFDCHLTFVQNSKYRAALTLDGIETSLGMIRGKVEICSFGPQAENMCFGISGKGMQGWTRCAAYPEVWLKMQATEMGFGLQFVGLKPEFPISLALYVKGKSCEVGNQILYPKSLRRFSGEAQEVSFEKKGFVTTDQPRRVQVIPLAGDQSFWGAEFLLSYPIDPLNPQISFCIS